MTKLEEGLEFVVRAIASAGHARFLLQEVDLESAGVCRGAVKALEAAEHAIQKRLQELK